MGSSIVGRDEERRLLAAFVGRVPDAPSALVLEGEPASPPEADEGRLLVVP